MSNETMREEFEAWISARSKHAYMFTERVDAEWVYRAGIVEDRLGQYVDGSTEQQWGVWQASRAAIEVDLEPDEPADEGAAYLHQDFVKARIESLGLKVKP